MTAHDNVLIIHIDVIGKFKLLAVYILCNLSKTSLAIL